MILHFLRWLFNVFYFKLHFNSTIYFFNGYHLYIDHFLEDLRDLSDVNKANVKFSLRNPSQPDDDVCYIVRGKPESLNSCNFKTLQNLFGHSWVDVKQQLHTFNKFRWFFFSMLVLNELFSLGKWLFESWVEKLLPHFITGRRMLTSCCGLVGQGAQPLCGGSTKHEDGGTRESDFS